MLLCSFALFVSLKVRLMRQSRKDQKALEAATKLAIKEAKAEAERLAIEEEAALTEGLDDLEKVLMRSTIKAKVSPSPPVFHVCALCLCCAFRALLFGCR